MIVQFRFEAHFIPNNVGIDYLSKFIPKDEIVEYTIIGKNFQSKYENYCLSKCGYVRLKSSLYVNEVVNIYKKLQYITRVGIVSYICDKNTLRNVLNYFFRKSKRYVL